ncbi:MAG: hypothetical protein Q8P50_17390 [Bacillota bacterium]|nr:hypothetical protein [Bacillota bacterium]
MQFPVRFRYYWWASLMVVSALYVQARWSAILGGNGTTADTTVLGLMIALALVPIFSEVTVLGVSLKQKIDEAKREIKQDVKESLLNLRMSLSSEMQSVVNVYPQYTRLEAPNADELVQLSKKVDDLAARYEHPAAKEKKAVREPSVPSAAEKAFASRYKLESAVRQAWEKRFGAPAKGLQPTMKRMIDDLVVREQALLPEIGDLALKTYAIGSTGVHGRVPTENELAFLDAATPKLAEIISKST